MRAGTTALHVLSSKGEIIPIPRWYPLREFIIHLTVEAPGWTVTHRRSHMAVIQKIRTRGQAVKLVQELELLTNKWKYIDNQESMEAWLNYRERGAILNLINEVRASRKWSYR